MRIFRRSTTAAALLLALAACDESPVSLPQASSVAVAGSAMSLMVGDLAPVAAQVLDQDGQVMQGLAPVYSTDNPAVATVGTDGMVRAVSPGTANVSATYGSSSAAVKVTVSADRRGELQSLDVQADSVVADVRAGAQSIGVRAFNGLGQPVCPQLTFRSTDPSVATARMGGTCRVEVVPLFAGETTITAEADGRTDSFRVRVSSSGAVAFFSARPAAAELVAGATVGYTVKVLNEANQPVPNQRVNLDVSVGTLSATTVTTGADGTATVQWTLPTHLQEWGQTHSISFRAPLPNGAIASRSEPVFVNGASMAEILVYTAPNGGPYVRTDADSTVVPAYSYAFMAVLGMDQYGNARVTDWTFSATGAQYWSWSCNGPVGSSLGSNGEYTCFYSYPGNLTVSARAATGEQRSVRFVFRN
jgi:hypothetical protein